MMKYKRKAKTITLPLGICELIDTLEKNTDFRLNDWIAKKILLDYGDTEEIKKQILVNLQEIEKRKKDVTALQSLLSRNVAEQDILAYLKITESKQEFILTVFDDEKIRVYVEDIVANNKDVNFLFFNKEFDINPFLKKIYDLDIFYDVYVKKFESDLDRKHFKDVVKTVLQNFIKKEIERKKEEKNN